MTIKQKILFRIALMSIVSSVAIIIIVLFNFRQYGVDSASERAEIISELVKNGLVSSMISGTMEKREVFLKNISQIKDVEKLWVARSEIVTRQYGDALKSELPRDKIDKMVLEKGEKYTKLDESLNRVVLRVSIPYFAESNEIADCLKCHDAEYGDILGVISMEFDGASIRAEGVDTIINILWASILALVLVIFLTNRLLNPYLELFESLKASIKKAATGNFTAKIQSNLQDEAGDMIQEYDLLLDKFDSTFGQIDKKLRTFVSSKNSIKSDPLTDAEGIITSLSRLYKFKKAIELDVTKEDIYGRLAYVIENYFNIKQFIMAEIDQQTNEFEVVLKQSDYLLCDQIMDSDADGCRAKRTGNSVASDDFPELCPCFTDPSVNYFCIPINIGGKVGLIIHIVSDSNEEFERIKAQEGLIKIYANEAAPVIETKKLMKILRDSSLKDAMTGLYNRRFLDEYVDKLKPQVLRQKISIGILMIDMDHFKMVNDTYGHDAGDIVLKELAHTLSDNVRGADLVIRYGGEEFIILLMDVESEEKVLEIAEKLRLKIFNKDIEIGENKRLKKTISIGISMFPKDCDSIWQSIKYADIALYQAKDAGRNKIVRFNEDMWKDEPNF